MTDFTSPALASSGTSETTYVSLSNASAGPVIRGHALLVICDGLVTELHLMSQRSLRETKLLAQEAQLVAAHQLRLLDDAQPDGTV
jgi:hypothetical protein